MWTSNSASILAGADSFLKTFQNISKYGLGSIGMIRD